MPCSACSFSGSGPWLGLPELHCPGPWPKSSPNCLDYSHSVLCHASALTALWMPQPAFTLLLVGGFHMIRLEEPRLFWFSWNITTDPNSLLMIDFFFFFKPDWAFWMWVLAQIWYGVSAALSRAAGGLSVPFRHLARLIPYPTILLASSHSPSLMLWKTCHDSPLVIHVMVVNRC